MSASSRARGASGHGTARTGAAPKPLGGPLPLRIRLERERDAQGVATSSVTFELAADVGKPVQVAGCASHVLGLPEDIADLERPPHRSPRFFRVPHRIVRAIHEQARRIGDGRWEALWLEFPRPSGCLSMLPWERMLHYGPRGLPIVRRPYSLVRPWTPENSLEVVLCASVLPRPADSTHGEPSPTAPGPAPGPPGPAPGTASEEPPGAAPEEASEARSVARSAAKPDAMAHATSQAMSEAMSEAVDTVLDTFETVIGEVRRRARVHVFAGPGLRAALRPYAGRQRDLELIVHDPPAAHPAAEPADPVRDPWLRWIRAELGERAVDVVHVLGDGALLDGEGALILQELTDHGGDPVRPGPTAVGSAELSTFLMQVGAWSLVLSGAPGNTSGCGLRELADSVARVHPGSVLVHDSARDPALSALKAAYVFLYRTEDTRPPLSDALSTWAYPLRLDYHFGSGAEPVTLNAARLLLDEEGHTAIHGDRIENAMAAEDTPMWLAAGIRYLERVQAQWLPPPSGTEDKSHLARRVDVRYALDQAVFLLDRVLAQQTEEPGVRPGGRTHQDSRRR
ncbi:hypothetical protein [Streptomyces sp. NPDC003077]|uniref:hypothetical protein n=1 Tax=Streptomyces sp. NPDC003077 TaxID=3154443 RepID=UPI0033A46DF5